MSASGSSSSRKATSASAKPLSLKGMTKSLVRQRKKKASKEKLGLEPASQKKKKSPRKPIETQLKYADLDLKNWRDYDHIETGSLWLWDQRQRQEGHQNDYHGNCVPQILTQLLSRYTKKNEIILDLFLGSGTSAIEAVNLGRRAVGVELLPEMVDYVQQKLDNQGKSNHVRLIQGDSSNLRHTRKKIEAGLAQLGQKKAQFSFLHPPYADIIQFSETEQCLSNAGSVEAFLNQFEQVAQQAYDQLEPGRFAGLVIGDKYAKGEWVPLGFNCMERMNAVGFKTKSIIVKNMAGNEKGKGRQANLWRYRALKGGFYIFEHEYVMVFQKPS